MLHFTNTVVNLAGRGSDIADSDLTDILPRRVNTGLNPYIHLVQNTTCFKTTTQRKHAIFPHRDNMLLEFYFSLSYLLVMCSEKILSSEGKLFPSFAQKVFNKDGEVESKVSELFNKWIDMFMAITHDLYGSECYTCDSNHVLPLQI